MVRQQNYIDSENLIICNICGEKFHLSDRCPSVQQIPNIKKVIYDYKFLGTQLRIKYDRSFKFQFNAYMEKQEIAEIIDEIFEVENNADPELLEVAVQWREFYLSLNDEDEEDGDDHTSTSKSPKKKRRMTKQDKRLSQAGQTSISQTVINQQLMLSKVQEHISSSSHSSSYLSDSEIYLKRNKSKQGTSSNFNLSK